MKTLRLILAIALLSGLAFGQAWSGILDPSRATTWSGNAGFTIPAYTVACPTQPTLIAGSGNAAANTASIQTALASCDATHNVVNIPAGTYYFNGWKQGTTAAGNGGSYQVVRGAGPGSTYLYTTSTYPDNCAASDICMANQYPGGAYSSSSLPGGAEACSWTAGYSQGATSITLNSCGSAPTVGQMIILDQANDSSTNTGGVWTCDTYTSGGNCTLKGNINSNAAGRVIGGVDYAEQQVTYVTAVSGSGSGPYTVTISPGVFANNIRSGQTPGAWWNGFVQNLGIENLTIDHAGSTNAYGINMWNCYQCWIKNVRSLNGRRDHIQVLQGMNDVIRDSYFYQSQDHTTSSYGIEPQESSDVLVENNIFQQVTNPVLFGQGSGWVVGYNFSTDDVVVGSYMETSYATHNAGNMMNLWEGNSLPGIISDDQWGTSSVSTYFRNLLTGWESGYTYQTIPVNINAYNRGYNVVGNVLGQPGFSTQYQAYATSTTAGSGAAAVNTSIYSLGWTDNSGIGVCTTGSGLSVCDSLVFSTLMRWGNYDIVNAATQWNSTEASPASVAYIAANFTSGYFGSLAHTLPSSLYLSGKPAWWRAMPYPALGPDVSSGGLGVCSGGTYAGAMATAGGQCSGGSLSASQWAGHANAIPAQDCFLNVMNGPADGTGSVLTFDANTCYYTSGPPAAPTGLTAVAR